MKATAWEFRHRATLFGLIFGVSFFLYQIDPQNALLALAGALLPARAQAPEWLVHALFALAALWIAAAALLRTWASAFLHADVVYAAEVRSAELVADGPYRHLRNPLYFGNLLMVVGMAGMMSRAGAVLAAVLMLLFCCRLILREEAELRSQQGQLYENYRRTVPRLWPSLRPVIAASGRKPDWRAGFRAELWVWGFSAAVVGFAITLTQWVFFVLLGASLALFFTL